MGSTMVFIHSTGATPQMWAAAPVEALRGVEVFTPANLGYPPRLPVARDTPCGVDDDVALLGSQLPAEGTLHLVAHSYGGLVALKLLPAIQDRVGSVYLFEPVMFGALNRSAPKDPAVAAELKRFADDRWFLHDEDTGGREAWLSAFIDFWNKPGSWSRMPEEAKASTRSLGWKMFQEVRSVFNDANDFEDFVVRAPLTLVKAERSPASSRAMVDALAKVNPHAHVETLAGTGHMAPLTHPPIFAESLSAHWRRLAFT